MEVRLAPKLITLPRGFGDVIPALHHQPLAVKWKHRRVHKEKDDGQSTTTCKRSP